MPDIPDPELEAPPNSPAAFQLTVTRKMESLTETPRAAIKPPWPYPTTTLLHPLTNNSRQPPPHVPKHYLLVQLSPFQIPSSSNLKITSSMPSRDVPSTKNRQGRQQSAPQSLSPPSRSRSSTRDRTHGSQSPSEPMATFAANLLAKDEVLDHSQCLSDVSMEDGNDGGPRPLSPTTQPDGGPKSGRLFTSKLDRCVGSFRWD